MKINRRDFLKTTAATSLFFAGFGLPSFAGQNKKNLVVIMLEGGMDGLCAVPIRGDKNFKKLRSEINLKKTLKLTSDFDLHPALENFKALWDQNTASVFHATSIPYKGRSHFEGQDMMMSGGTVPYQEKTGWLGRGMKLAGLKGNGLAMSLPMPLLIRGVPLNNNYFPIRSSLPQKRLLNIIAEEFNQYSEKDLSEILSIVRNRDLNYFPGTNAATLALEAGKLLSDPNGPRVAVFKVENFDTHAAQGGENGTHADCLKEYDQILKALKASLGSTFKDTLILTLTEFGRTVKQNGGKGTEHGYGTAVLMAGGLIKKSEVHGDWPGLKKKDLFEGRDLNSTMDARSIYASAMSTVFDLDFKRIQKDVFWGDKLDNLSDKLFKA
jgi:uncharacterized protein (DUF1501 family)